MKRLQTVSATIILTLVLTSSAFASLGITHGDTVAATAAQPGWAHGGVTATGEESGEEEEPSWWEEILLMITGFTHTT